MREEAWAIDVRQAQIHERELLAAEHARHYRINIDLSPDAIDMKAPKQPFEAVQDQYQHFPHDLGPEEEQEAADLAGARIWWLWRRGRVELGMHCRQAANARNFPASHRRSSPAGWQTQAASHGGAAVSKPLLAILATQSTYTCPI